MDVEGSSGRRERPWWRRDGIMKKENWVKGGDWMNQGDKSSLSVISQGAHWHWWGWGGQRVYIKKKKCNDFIWALTTVVSHSWYFLRHLHSTREAEGGRKMQLGNDLLHTWQKQKEANTPWMSQMYVWMYFQVLPLWSQHFTSKQISRHFWLGRYFKTTVNYSAGSPTSQSRQNWAFICNSLI